MKKIIAAAALTAVMISGLYALEKPTLVVNSGHVSSVCSAVFSPDGSKLVTVGSSREDAVRIWDIESGRELHSVPCNNTDDNELSYSTDGSAIICYSPKADLSLIIDAETGKEIINRYGVTSPDGKLIAQCASRDGMIRIIDVRSGKNIIQFKGHTAPINALSFSPDGRFLASGSSIDNRVRLWDVRSGKKIHDLEYTTYVEAVFFTPDGGRIIAGGGRFVMWDAKSGKKIREGGPNNVNARSLSADGRLLTAANREEISVRELESGSTVLSVKNEGFKVSIVRFSPDGTRLVSTGKNADINLWDISSGKLLRTLKEKNGFFPFAAFSPDGKTLVSYLNGALHLWDAETGNLRRSIRSVSAQTKMIALAPDGKSIVSAERHGRICVISPNGKKTVRPLTDKAGQINAIAVSPDGRKLVTSASNIDRNLNVWDISRSNAKPLFSYPHFSPDAVSFSADGKTFIVADNHEIQKIDAETGESKGYIIKEDKYDSIRAAAFTPDGSRLIYASLLSMKICDASDGGNERAFPSCAGDSKRLAVSPDGTTVLGAEKYGIRVTDIAAGKNRLLLTHSENSYVWSVAFDREGKRIVSTDSHGTIRIWNAATGKQIHLLKGHTGNVINAQFTPDGTRVISSGSDTTIRIWDAAEGRLIATLYNFYGSEFAVVTPEGTYDGTPEALELLHWTVGSEVLPLSSFGENFRVNDLLASALYGPLLKPQTAAAQSASSSAKPDIAKRLIGKIHSVSSDEVIVSYSGSGYLPKIGERFFVMNNEGEQLYLECAFPMISVSKCRFVKASDRKEIKKGMPVFR